MLLVSIRLLFVCIRLLLVCTRVLLVCTRMLLVAPVRSFSHDLSYVYAWSRIFIATLRGNSVLLKLFIVPSL